MSHYDDYCREREEPEEERDDGPTEFPDDPPGKCYAMWRGIHDAVDVLGDGMFNVISADRIQKAYTALETAKGQIRAMERALHIIAEWKKFERSDRPLNEVEQGANIAIDCFAAIAREVIGPEEADPDPSSADATTLGG